MNRIYTLDVAKSLAIFLVIFTHLKEKMGYFTPNSFVNIFSYYIDRLGVPLFFMVSGVLLLSAERNFSSKIAKRIIYIMVGVSIASILTNSIYYNLFFGPKSILVSIQYNNTITSKNIDKAYQLWYIFQYIPLFILSIPLSYFTSRASQRQLAYLCVALFILGPLSQTIHYRIVTNDYLAVVTKTDLFSYSLYMVLGLYIFRIQGDRHIVLPTLLLIVTTATASMLTYIFPSRLSLSVWYSREIPLYISSSCLFYLICNVDCAKLTRLVNFISQNSYSVYLIHVSLIYVAVYLISEIINNVLYIITASIFVILSSFLISYLINKTPLRLFFR